MFWSQVAAVIAIISVIGGVLAMVLNRVAATSVRRRRLDVLEKALQHGSLDDATRQQLLQVLAREAGGGWITKPGVWARLSFGAGWIMFVISGGMLLLWMTDVIRYIDDDVVFGFALLGLALMTLPLGLREFARRDSKLADQG